jgi:hypothetical protein
LFVCFWQHWGLNSGPQILGSHPTTWASLPAIFSFFKKQSFSFCHFDGWCSHIYYSLFFSFCLLFFFPLISRALKWKIKFENFSFKNC